MTNPFKTKSVSHFFTTLSKLCCSRFSPTMVVGRLIRKMSLTKKTQLSIYFISLIPFILIFLLLNLIGNGMFWAFERSKLIRKIGSKLINKVDKYFSDPS